MPGALSGPKGIKSMEPEPQRAVNHHIGPLNWTLVLCKRNNTLNCTAESPGKSVHLGNIYRELGQMLILLNIH